MRVLLVLASLLIYVGCYSVPGKTKPECIDRNTPVSKACTDWNSNAVKKEAPTLKIYVVSKDKIPNGEYIDTKEFPKVGYINRVPEFKVKTVEYADSRPCHEIINFDGKKEDLGLIPYLSISLKDKDKAVFEKFTEKNIDKRIVLMIGTRIVAGPVIKEPITNGNISLNMTKSINCNELQKELDKLVK